MVHIHRRKKTPVGCNERLARSGSCREGVRGVVGTMNAVRSRPNWLATVQLGRKQTQSRVCTQGLRYTVVGGLLWRYDGHFSELLSRVCLMMFILRDHKYVVSKLV